MAWGTIAFGGDKDRKIEIISKVYDTFGCGSFITSQLSGFLSDDELEYMNMNKLKHRNVVSHAGSMRIRGRSTQMWKLNPVVVDILKREGKLSNTKRVIGK